MAPIHSPADSSRIDQSAAFDARLRGVAAAAAARWARRADVRDERSAALANGNLLAADSPDRLAMRLNTLVDDVRATSRGRRLPDNATLRDLVTRTEPITAAQISDALVQEVVLGAREFLSVEFLERGVVAAHCVGRVVVSTGRGEIARGTGFLVADGVLLTNEHVLPDADFAAECGVEMDYEANRFGPPRLPNLFRLAPERLFLADRDLDFALVAVEPRGSRGTPIAGYGWLPLHRRLGKIAVTPNDYINIVQHPLGRAKEIVLRENRVLDLRTGNEAGADAIGAFLHYEADTEKGSSGSPVLNDQWEVVALHHSGVPETDADGRWLDRDGNRWTEDRPVADIAWIANEGVRVSSLVAAISAATLSGEAATLVQRVLNAAPAASGDEAAPAADEALPEAVAEAAAPARAVAQPRPAPVPGPKAAAAAATPAGTASFEIPLRITVSLGGVTVAAGDTTAAPPPEPAPAADPRQEALRASDFRDRPGYDPRFLGVDVPLPTLKPAPRFGGFTVIPRPSRPEDVNELRYRRHSVLMCAGRRLAYVSTCNVDFDPPVNLGRKDGTSSWRLDPRLDAAQQLGAIYYSNNDYDRGHLTRRDDVAWGSSKADALQANNDSFFFPNAAPQYFTFNQSDDFTGLGLDLWGDLENFISEQGAAQRTRLAILNGPVFGTADKPYKDALVPLQFWKIVVWRDGQEAPGALGFLLDQSSLVRDLAEEAIAPGRFAIRQRRIADIEALLDLDFGVVRGFDRMPPAVEESLDDAISIRTLADIVGVK